MKTNIGSLLNNALTKTSVYFQTNGPKILVAGGVIGVVASGVMACVATTKAPEVIVEAQERLEIIHASAKEEEKKKAITQVYFKTGAELAGLYLPSVGLGALSITAILTSHNMLTRRNASLAAAYTTLDATFKGYRQRVAAKYGEEAERAIRYNLTEETLEEVVVDENGKEKKVKKKVKVAGVDQVSDYARYFMEKDLNDPFVGSDYCNASSIKDYNVMFLNQQERYMNDRLIARGFVTLNEVYEKLGFPPSLAGQTVGWIYDPDNKEHVGDSYIKFIRTDVHYKHKDGSYSPAILIDFNVDGVITEKAVKMGLLAA